MLDAFYKLDLAIFHFFNGWAGNGTAEQLVLFSQDNPLFSGGIILVAYWWFWFAESNQHRAANRQKIVEALIGAVASLVLARTLALALPFRPRPFSVPGIGFHASSSFGEAVLENWSSFPSDHAALFFALTFGLFRLSRPLGAALMAWATVWICIPRIYGGLHYPSDILGGALIGIATVLLSSAAMRLRRGAPGRKLMALVEICERRWPQLFYAIAFALSFEITVLFDDVRHLARAMVQIMQQAGYVGADHGAALFLACGTIGLGLVASAALVVLLKLRLGEARSRSGSVPFKKPVPFKTKACSRPRPRIEPDFRMPKSEENIGSASASRKEAGELLTEAMQP